MTMLPIQIHHSLYIQSVEGKGWGVFSKIDLEAGCIIECSPVLILSPEDSGWAKMTAIYDYLFDWKPETTSQTCVAWGYLSMYNHCPEANCAYAMNYAEGTMHIETLRKVPAHTELTINYHGDFDDKRPVWFPLAGSESE